MNPSQLFRSMFGLLVAPSLICSAFASPKSLRLEGDVAQSIATLAKSDKSVYGLFKSFKCQYIGTTKVMECFIFVNEEQGRNRLLNDQKKDIVSGKPTYLTIKGGNFEKSAIQYHLEGGIILDLVNKKVLKESYDIYANGNHIYLDNSGVPSVNFFYFQKLNNKFKTLYNCFRDPQQNASCLIQASFNQ